VKTASAEGVMMATVTTGTVTEMAMATGIETENVTVIVETTDAATSVVNLTTAGSVVMKATVAGIIATRTEEDIAMVEEVVRRMAPRAVVDARGGMDLVLQSAGLLPLRVPSLSPSGDARLQDGMFMLQDMNNIQLCKPSKQVGC